MDFGTLLHTAQKNKKSGKKEGVRCYSTKFEPPKKEQRNKQQLSENIKRFLAKKEAEERAKQQVAQRKKEELLALRAKDSKATRRVNVMLKRTKSANQSVIQDAIDTNNTSVTLAGPIQPDEDDYGYVSQEAAAFYNKMMEKYSRMPEEPKFPSNKRKKVSTDLIGTKERVKAALEREREEASMPHRRKRKHREEEEVGTESQQEEAPRPKAKVAAPPPINFNDLLKLAEKKQFEPIIIEQKPKEEERLFTKKQKKEMEREKEWRDRKEGRLPPLDPGTSNSGIKVQKSGVDKGVREVAKKVVNILQKTQTIKRTGEGEKKTKVGVQQEKRSNENVPLPNRQSVPSDKQVGFNNKTRELIELKKKEMLAKKVSQSEVKPKQFTPRDLQPKQLPPPDIKRNEYPPKDVKRKAMVNKRRILDDEEYDPEMDDFIDDGPEEGEDYSKYISEIFGYDKSKYRNVDDDIDNMESTFAQQMREEVISTKIGIMEDLEDMKKEEEEKRRKALMKKRKL